MKEYNFNDCMEQCERMNQRVEDRKFYVMNLYNYALETLEIAIVIATLQGSAFRYDSSSDPNIIMESLKELERYYL